MTILSENKLPLMGYSTGDVFCRDHFLSAATRKLIDAGIKKVSDLITLDEGRFVEITDASPKIVKRAKASLENFGGLRFGMRLS